MSIIYNYALADWMVAEETQSVRYALTMIEEEPIRIREKREKKNTNKK